VFAKLQFVAKQNTLMLIEIGCNLPRIKRPILVFITEMSWSHHVALVWQWN